MKNIIILLSFILFVGCGTQTTFLHKNDEATPTPAPTTPPTWTSLEAIVGVENTTRLAVYNETPYVAYQNASSVYIKKYVSNSWEDLDSLTDGYITANKNIDLFIYGGDPYIVYQNSVTPQNLLIKKYHNGWSNVSTLLNVFYEVGGVVYGNPDIRANPLMQIDTNGDILVLLANEGAATPTPGSPYLYNSSVGTSLVNEGVFEYDMKIYNNITYVVYKQANGVLVGYSYLKNGTIFKGLPWLGRSE